MFNKTVELVGEGHTPSSFLHSCTLVSNKYRIFQPFWFLCVIPSVAGGSRERI